MAFASFSLAPALSDQAYFAAANDSLTGKSADALCDELLAHVCDCDACINGFEECCPVYCSFQEQIALAGGPVKSAFLAA